MIGRLGAEVDFDPVSIERRVCIGAGQRNRIDVGTDYEACPTRSRNACKQPRAGSDIQYGLWFALPTEQIDSRGAKACGRMRSIAEHDRLTRDGRE